MHFVIFAGLILLALIFQITLVNYIQVWGVSPDLIFVLIAINGFLRGTREGALAGFAAGLAADLLAGNSMGLGALSGLATGYIAGLGEARLFKENHVIVLGVVWLASFAGQLVFYLLISAAGLGISPLVAIFRIIIPVSTYNALFSLFIYGRYYRFVQKGLFGRDLNY